MNVNGSWVSNDGSERTCMKTFLIHIITKNMYISSILFYFYNVKDKYIYKQQYKSISR